MAVERAVALGCDAMQIFVRNPRSWAVKRLERHEVELFKRKRREAGLFPVVVHTTYLINLSSPESALFKKSLLLFKKELSMASALEADYLVTHLGSSRGSGAEAAFSRISRALKSIRKDGLGDNTMILFENSAGGGDTFGSDLAQIGGVIDFADSIGLETGLCYDTCHGFAAGYCLSTGRDAGVLARRISREVAPGRLKLIHLNDSKGAFGSRVDRHEHIGKGAIGTAGLKAFFGRREFSNIPIIMETPMKEERDEQRNLRAARRLIKQGRT
jgi:deoxyribonuclease-4